MALTNAYCTLAELKANIVSGSPVTFTAADDDNLELAIQAASQWIDSYFDGTTFYARTETRYYTARWSDYLDVDDLLTVTTLKTDEDDDGTYEVTWTTDDYWLEPKNAQLGRQPTPYRHIRVNQNGDYSFPTGVEYGIEIAGTWGYCTAAKQPPEIKLATILMAHRLWKRKDAIFGVAGTPALGVTIIQSKIQQDSDIVMLLSKIDRPGY